VSSCPPGVKEDAGILCHNNTWINPGWCLLGDGDRALEYTLSICPSAKEEQIETYRSEPYVYAQMIAGKDAPCFGEAKNSWLTQVRRCQRALGRVTVESEDDLVGLGLAKPRGRRVRLSWRLWRSKRMCDGSESPASWVC
jgi:hypothetical protein